MTPYDAGPGEWSDRPWESPDKKPRPHARRRRMTLPPWALLAILVGILILLCVGLILIVKAIKGGDRATPTPPATATRSASPTITPPAIAPTAVITRTPTATVVLPLPGTPGPTPLIQIAPGALVVVQGTTGAGLNLRQQPTTYSRIETTVREGTVLLVLDGPTEADGYVWWKLRSPEGKEGWGAANWLVLKIGQD